MSIARSVRVTESRWSLSIAKSSLSNSEVAAVEI